MKSTVFQQTSVSYLISVDPAVKSCSHSGYALLTVAGNGVTSIALSHNVLHLTVLRLVHNMTLDVHNMMLRRCKAIRFCLHLVLLHR